MRSIDDLRLFCMGYIEGAAADDADLSGVDDWVTWGGYYINLFGSYLSQNVSGSAALQVDAYEDRADQSDLFNNPPLVSFVLELSPQSVV